MKIGMTGTRHGATESQLSWFRQSLLMLDATELHHGDCVGADAQAHQIARDLGLRVVGHPPIKEELRAFCECDELREPDDYLVRNRHIVQETEILLALPQGPEEVRSGTWSTVRYAQSHSRRVLINLPVTP